MTHDPMCPCSKADERGCFLISANTGKCVSCVCGDKMDTYLDGYDRALRAAREAVAAVVVQARWGTTSHGLIGKGEALAAIDALKGENG